MIKVEPQTIINFMATHFDLLSTVFEQLDSHREIDYAVLHKQLQTYENDVEKQLFKYEIFVETNDSIHFKSEYFDFFVFLLKRYKPVLPETIEKYGQSINELFNKIKGKHDNNKQLIAEIDDLVIEINELTKSVTQNTKGLLSESRLLKANVEKITYPDKLAQASHLIDNYIKPLNTILDSHHSQSIFSNLLRISSYVSMQVQVFANEHVRLKFVTLYRITRQSTKHLQEQSHILVKELLPLIERIKTESEYLTGFFRYLNNGNCYTKYSTPKIIASKNQKVYSPEINETTKSYFEQVKPNEPTYISIIKDEDSGWIYDKQKYKNKLKQSLPIDNFYQWCKQELNREKPQFKLTEYFMITALYFEAEFDFIYQNQEITLDFQDNNQTIRLTVPLLQVTNQQSK